VDENEGGVASPSNKRALEDSRIDGDDGDGEAEADMEAKRRKILEETRDIDADSDGDGGGGDSNSDSSEEEDSGDEEDETAELLRELEKIKRERAEQREKEVCSFFLSLLGYAWDGGSGSGC